MTSLTIPELKKELESRELYVSESLKTTKKGLIEQLSDVLNHGTVLSDVFNHGTVPRDGKRWRVTCMYNDEASGDSKRIKAAPPLDV